MSIWMIVIYLLLIYVISLLIAPYIKDKKYMKKLIIVSLISLIFTPYVFIIISLSSIIVIITKIDGLKLSKK